MKPGLTYKTNNNMMRTAILLLALFISMSPLQSAEKRGNDPTGTSDAANPFDTDSDGDGISDGDEDQGETDPLDPNGFPAQVIEITKSANGY